MPPAVPPAPPAAEPLEWACRQCTLLNPLLELVCRACEQAREPLPHALGTHADSASDAIRPVYTNDAPVLGVLTTTSEQGERRAPPAATWEDSLVGLLGRIATPATVIFNGASSQNGISFPIFRKLTRPCPSPGKVNTSERNRARAVRRRLLPLVPVVAFVTVSRCCSLED